MVRICDFFTGVGYLWFLGASLALLMSFGCDFVCCCSYVVWWLLAGLLVCSFGFAGFLVYLRVVGGFALRGCLFVRGFGCLGCLGGGLLR